NREATDDVIKILQEENAQEIGGIMHCYSATREEVQPVLDLNFHISLGGPVTSKNAHDVQEVAKLIRLDRLLIERDAPFLAPHPNRGKRNEPAYVKLVAEETARLREMDVSELAKITTVNACRFFGISDCTEVAFKSSWVRFNNCSYPIVSTIYNKKKQVNSL